VPKHRISPRASADLIEIWSYIADDSVANADAFLDRLYQSIQALARQPGLGRHREELAPGLHSNPFGRYIIFYRAVTDAIEIVRVLHGARDIESISKAKETNPRVSIYLVLPKPLLNLIQLAIDNTVPYAIRVFDSQTPLSFTQGTPSEGPVPASVRFTFLPLRTQRLSVRLSFLF
jgi:toxin ParE1/3/4